jgi:hypothetical protein
MLDMGLTSVLKKLEWSGTSREDFGHHDYDNVPCCPSCGALGWKHFGGYEHMHKGHKEDCELDAAIKVTEDS